MNPSDSGLRPLFLSVPTFRVDECLEELREVLSTGWTGPGSKTLEFEKAWTEYTGLPHAHFVNSATAGLHLSLRLLREQGQWQDGDEIITTPLTFVSTNHVILYERLRPIFADVDEYLCLDPAVVKSRITSRTRAVMFVGLGGNTGRLQDIATICREHGLKLILDAAHMSGTRLDGQHVGPQADACVFSFQAVKNLPTADSGMVCFTDPDLDISVRQWSWLGIDRDTFARSLQDGAQKWHYEVLHEGFKYHGNSVMAALAMVSLKYLDQDNGYRRQLAAWYDQFLDSRIERVPIPAGCETSRHLYQVLVDCRDEIVLALNDQGIYPGVHYRENTVYPMYSYARGTCPRATEASARLISLPLHMQLEKRDVERIANSLIRAAEFATSNKAKDRHAQT